MMKIGIVTAVDVATAKCRVQFADQDNMQTYWLPVLHHKTGKDKSYWMPDLAEHVCCLMDDNAEFGCILGAIYSDADTPPVTSQDKYHVRFKDGTWIEYDRANHKLAASVQGTVDLVATGDVTSTAPTWTHNGELVVTGNILSQSNITATGNVSDAGGAKSMAGMRQTFNQHTHPENGEGGGTTSQPNQQQ